MREKKNATNEISKRKKGISEVCWVSERNDGEKEDTYKKENKKETEKRH